ncbi:MAG TPA: hypothetical protein VJM15_07710 [Sphingomicrobium sp.]|nr:hypothetical protein [Sphingomicrobium sp.]
MPALFDDSMIREIYRRGVRDACQWAGAHLPLARRREMEAWLSDLDLWAGGEPPRPSPPRADAPG